MGTIWTQLARALLVGAWLAGCGSGDDDGNEGGAGSGASADAGNAGSGAGGDSGSGGAGGQPALDPTELVGDFGLTIKPEMANVMNPALIEQAHAKLLGKLFDKPKLPMLQFALEDELGDCKLLLPDVPVCDPRCKNSVCTNDGCVQDAVAQDAAGTVTVTGLGEPLRLEPMTSMPTYQPASLPYPPCVEGELVRVEAEAFSVETACIAPLELPDTTIGIKSNEATVLSWTPPADGQSTRMEIEVDISHHGGQKGQIDCDVPDTGAFEIPEPLVTQLVALGVGGYPTITLTRVSRAAAPEAPGITLSVMSGVDRLVDTGFVSCSMDSDCPDGMTCDLMRLICL